MRMFALHLLTAILRDSQSSGNANAKENRLNEIKNYGWFGF